MAPIPKTQTAVVARKFGDDYLVEVDNDYAVPELKPGQALVRLSHSGVCHSDLSGLAGHWQLKQTCAVPGHEGVGHVAAYHESVDTSKHLPVGAYVGVPLCRNPCFSCNECLEPDGETNCATGIYNGFQHDGTYQQYIAVEANYMVPVPDGVNPEVVGPVLCGGVTVYKAIKLSGAIAGNWIVIAGAGGGLGTMAVQYAVARGLRVVGIDTGDDKKKKILELGAEAFIDFAKVSNTIEEVSKITGGGASVAVVLAPVEKTYNEAPYYVKIGGTVVCVGLPADAVRLSFNPQLVIFRRIKLIGSLVGTRKDCIEALDFVARGKVIPDVEVHQPGEIMEILSRMEKGKIVGRAVLAF